MLGSVAPGRSQSLPSEPLVFGAGRVTVGGDVSATVSCAEPSPTESCGRDTGFFNYSDYEYSTLRMVRVDVNATVRANRFLSVLAEIRSENGESPHPYGVYVRLRPWPKRAFDIQAGRIPPTFGAFGRRTYANDNILIGYPLAYQYLTSLRPDAVPANADELLQMRGRGWLSNFSVGSPTRDRGVPVVAIFRWDTGVQAHAAASWLDVSGAVTTGSLANPLVGDDNGGKQLAGRVAVRPQAGLVLGVSAARGQFLTRTAARFAGSIDPGRDALQSAIGADGEYSRDYYLIRFEAVRSIWTLPTIGAPLRATGAWVEGRYKIHPRLYTAARLDHLGFSTITGAAGAASWEAPVSRVEVGGGYSIMRNLQLKLSFQRNNRPGGGRVRDLQFGAAQAVFWF